jgi:hypothetical protein
MPEQNPASSNPERKGEQNRQRQESLPMPAIPFSREVFPNLAFPVILNHGCIFPLLHKSSFPN